MKKVKINSIRSAVKLHGRTIYDDVKEVLYFNWTCAGLEFDFYGKSLLAEFFAVPGTEIDGMPWEEDAPRRSTWPWVGVFIDGEEKPSFTYEINNNREVKSIFLSEENEQHTIRIVKLTENYKTYVGISELHMDGEILEHEFEKKRSIEFIGDSITCGFGNMTEDKDRLFYSEDENGWMSYGSIAARMLNMDWNMISMSGICSQIRRGMPMDYGMDDLYIYTDRIWQEKVKEDQDLLCWDFHAAMKDYVVINLGTNDATGIMLTEDQDDELKRFYKGYMEFIKTVRACNGPETRIICALGSMDYYLYHDILNIVEEYKNQTKDNKISCLRFKKMVISDPIGACSHPNIVTDKKMAEELVWEIQKLESESSR